MTDRPSQGHRLQDDQLELWAPNEAALLAEAASAVTEIAGRGHGAADLQRLLQLPGRGEDRLRGLIESALSAAGAAVRATAVEFLQHAHGVWARIDLDRGDGDLCPPQPYQELDHTADAGVRVHGATAGETLARLVCVFGQLLSGGDGPPARDRARMSASDGDLAMAAADLLRDLLYRFATERVVPVSCRTVRIDGAGVEIEVGLAPWDASQGRGQDIKAVTLHGLRFEPEGAGWVAQVVFDV